MECDWRAGRARSADQIIVIGGHLDSWDVAESATDDAAGVAICAAAAHLISKLPRRPRRSIRVVLWGSEETGGSGAAYAEQHRGELANVVLASESDLGAGRINQAAFSTDVSNDPRIADLATVLAPLDIFVSRQAATFAGTDVEDLRMAGIPVVRFSQDDRYYFDTHHSADDRRLNKVTRADLNQNVGVSVISSEKRSCSRRMKRMASARNGIAGRAASLRLEDPHGSWLARVRAHREEQAMSSAEKRAVLAPLAVSMRALVDTCLSCGRTRR